jgi:hypothetical protein
MLVEIFKPASQYNIPDNQNPQHKHHGNFKSHTNFLFLFFPEAEDSSDCQVTKIQRFQNGAFNHTSEANWSPTVVVVVVVAVVVVGHECH